MLRIALLLAALSTGAAAQPSGLRPADRPRMEVYEANLGRALAGALAAGAPWDVETLTAVMAGTPGRLAPEGDWSCRTLKLGGLAPLTVYPAFRCRIAATGPARGGSRN